MAKGIRDELKEVQPMQVIRTTNMSRGEGTESDPVRQIVQYWTVEGELLDECDPFLYDLARKAGKTGKKTS